MTSSAVDRIIAIINIILKVSIKRSTGTLVVVPQCKGC